MTERTIIGIFEGVETSDGAGVRLKRIINHKIIEKTDPFLMLDFFGSENPDDYIAGFPWHPHRGIETVTYMLIKTKCSMRTAWRIKVLSKEEMSNG